MKKLTSIILNIYIFLIINNILSINFDNLNTNIFVNLFLIVEFFFFYKIL